MKLKDKVALITGAGSGIGRATALLFAQEGAKIVVADYSVEDGEETVRQTKERGGEAIFVKVDVSQSADVQKMVRTAIDKYGRLDILHNNAGIEDPLVPTKDLSEADWDRVLSINLKGVFLSSKYTIPQMLKQGGGVIVNTASVAGLVGSPNMPAYCASKGGVVLLTKVMALEYARANIRVNCICPGPISTPMLDRLTLAGFQPREPMGRSGQPEEIAQAALYLASDQSSFVTGIALVVDGGLTAR